MSQVILANVGNGFAIYGNGCIISGVSSGSAQLDAILRALHGRIDLVVTQQGSKPNLPLAFDAIPQETVKAGEIARFATGRGNSSRRALREGVASWGYTVDGDDHAAALSLLHIKTAELDLPIRP